MVLFSHSRIDTPKKEAAIEHVKFGVRRLVAAFLPNREDVREQSGDKSPHSKFDARLCASLWLVAQEPLARQLTHGERFSAGIVAGHFPAGWFLFEHRESELTFPFLRVEGFPVDRATGAGEQALSV